MRLVLERILGEFVRWWRRLSHETLTRSRLRKGYRKENLTRIGKIPATKAIDPLETYGQAGHTLSAFANTTQIALPSDLPTVPETGEALVWFARKTELLLMGLRFKVFQRDRSMVLVTEGLGSQPFHGRTVLLINEHSHSAAEMVASFAKQNRLATLAGTKTAGEVLGGANFKLRSGYVLTRA